MSREDTGCSRAASRTLSAALFAGVAMGGCELVMVASRGMLPGLRATIPAALFSCGAIGLVAMAVGASIVMFMWLEERFWRVFYPLAGLSGLSIAIGYQDRFCGALVAGFSLLAVFFTSRRRSRSGGAALLCTLVCVWWLNPLFDGQSMKLAFSLAQISAIVSVAMLSLLFVFRGGIGGLEKTQVSILRAGLTSLAAIALSAASSIFMIRLWGFETMPHLKAVVFISQVALFLPAGLLLSRLFGSEARLVRRFGLLAVLVATLALAGILNLRDPRSTALLERSMPLGGAIAGSLSALFDSDSDGFSGAIGQSDCDDADPARNPLAVDLPGDRIDQNCIAGDMRAVRHDYFLSPVDVALPPAREGKRKIAVLLIIDTLRADHVDYALGNPDTPHLAEIASRSSVFERAYAQSNNTLESFPYILHMGYRILPRYQDQWTLRYWLEKGGLRSEAVLQASLPEWWTGGFHKVLMGFGQTFRGGAGARSQSADDTVARAIERLQVKDPRDFFLLVHFEQLHDSFSSIMEGDRMIGKGLNISEVFSFANPARTAQVMRSRYRQSLTDIDRSLAPLWQVITDLNESNELMLIVTSDHGEEFFEHGGFFHMGTLYEEQLRVPLFIYRNGQHIRRLADAVGINRISPTVLEYFGFEGRYVREMSLADQEIEPMEVFAAFEPEGKPERRQIAVFEDRMKIIFESRYGSYELYDLERDPEERTDLASSPGSAEAADRMRELLDRTLFFLNYGDLVTRRR